MKYFREILILSGFFVYSFAHTENTTQALEKKIEFLQAVIADIMQNPPAPLPQNQATQESTSLEKEGEDCVPSDGDHRLTLRIPKSLMAKIDIKRKQRIGKISRNLWILETLERATRK